MTEFLDLLNEKLKEDEQPTWEELERKKIEKNRKRPIQNRFYCNNEQRLHYTELQERFAGLRKLQDRGWSGSNSLGRVFDKSA